MLASTRTAGMADDLESHAGADIPDIPFRRQGQLVDHITSPSTFLHIWQPGDGVHGVESSGVLQPINPNSIPTRLRRTARFVGDHE
jgi:hypothetical protein